MHSELFSLLYNFYYRVIRIIDELIDSDEIELAKSFTMSNYHVVEYAEEALVAEAKSKKEAVMKLTEADFCLTEMTCSFGKLVESGVIDQATCDALKKEADALRAMIEQTTDELRAQY